VSTFYDGLRPRLPMRASLVAGLVALGLALACKLAYAQATAQELQWVLGPSCAVAAWLGELRFSWEPAAGYVSHGVRMVVGPPCAGVNFLVACSLALYFSCQASFQGLRPKLLLFATSFGLSYLATVIANGARIALAAHLGHADFHAGLASHAAVHRLIGVGVYAFALLGVCGAASRLLDSRVRSATATHRIVIPLACYLGVALALPLLHRALGHRVPGLAEHAGQTLAAFGAVAALALLCDRALDRLSSGRARS